MAFWRILRAYKKVNHAPKNNEKKKHTYTCLHNWLSFTSIVLGHDFHIVVLNL